MCEAVLVLSCLPAKLTAFFAGRCPRAVKAARNRPFFAKSSARGNRSELV
jgi:hypothetical protein